MNPACLASLAFILALAACSSGQAPETPEAAERATSFDGEVLRIAVEGPDGGKERFSSQRDRWFSWPWVPFLDNHSGRRWTMLKADREGASIAYALVSWDNDDPADYLAAGYWLRFDGVPGRRRFPLPEADPVLFIDGPEIDPAAPPELPLSGTASYIGEAGGVYAYRYGSGWAGPGEPVDAEEFFGTMTIEANFDDRTVAGCIGCVGDMRIERMHLYAALGWRADEPRALPTDYEIRLAPTAIRPDGSFADTGVSVAHPTREVTASSGDWGGSLSNRHAADGSPRLIAGFARAGFAEADGSTGSFDSIFIAPHPSVLPPPPEAPAPGR